MARASKKDFITETATGVFLENGFKGTSIDMVVTACAVSKPTVYNHFPDKRELMAAVMDRWLTGQTWPDMMFAQEDDYWECLAAYWWHPTALGFYRLVLGEGQRFEVAARRFWLEFDERWCNFALQAYPASGALSRTALEAQLSHRLWQRLKGSSW